MKSKLVIATIKSWNIRNADEFKNRFKGKYDVYIYTTKEQLNYDTLKEIVPIVKIANI